MDRQLQLGIKALEALGVFAFVLAVVLLVESVWH